MRKYVDKKDKLTSTQYDPNTQETRYFHLYCDICGVRHPDVCVNELSIEEGIEGDFCWECQLCIVEQGFLITT